jgi:hypothetical protein
MPGIEHHADFAVPVTQRVWLRTRVPRRNGQGQIEGWALALGWWVEANVNDDGTPGEPVGTLYLIVDEQDPGPPVWIAQGNIVETRWLA